MAKYQFGINGPFSGKLGTVVGCTWKGIPYMRSLPKKRTTKISPAEQANREKFKIAQLWLKPLTPFLRVGFKGYQERLEGFVAAKSYLLKNAVELEEGAFRVNPEKALLSYGVLAEATEVQVSIDQDHKLHCFWEPCNARSPQAREQAMLLAYCLAEEQAVYETHGAFREIGHDELILPPNFIGKTVLVYLAFVAPDRESQSRSVFLGEILVSID
nr:DUF6266 family protein [uncultured Pedobacter sp.]